MQFCQEGGASRSNLDTKQKPFPKRLLSGMLLAIIGCMVGGILPITI